MKIGILAGIFGGFGKKGFYNAQEIGMGKAVAALGHQAIVYKLVEPTEEPQTEQLGGMEVRYIPARHMGIHGFVDTGKLDTDLDALLYFADTQLCVPKVDRWCRKHGVRLIPYIGVMESHAGNKIKSMLMDSLFGRNLAVFRRRHCLAKNPDIAERLRKLGVEQVTFAPVGIDLDLLKKDYTETSPAELREKYGFGADDRIVLYIGRLEDEKRPIELVKMFDLLRKRSDGAYKLLIVGKGYLYDAVMQEIESRGLKDCTAYIERLPNDQIWELYRMSDVFVNMNEREIFGMVLMEAMFYECRLIAFHAPGPDYIVVNHESGELVDSIGEMADAVLREDDAMRRAGHDRVVSELTWRNTAEKILRTAQE